jgi:hypothetical protein
MMPTTFSSPNGLLGEANSGIKSELAKQYLVQQLIIKLNNSPNA